MKKFSSLLLSLALALALTVPALAVADTKAVPATETINNPIAAPEAADARAEEIKALGGTPGQINVRLNDKCVAFPDAFPELSNGNTMVPVRALVEALGAKVETPDAKTVKITLGDTVATLTIGELTVSLDRAGKTESLSLNAAPYIKGDRTYVPLRFVSEAFGYAVYWDQDYQTVVILDEAALAADLDKNFSIMNKLMEAQLNSLPKKMEQTTKFTANLELLNAQSGNKTYPITGEMKSYVDENAILVDFKMDASSLLTALADAMKGSGVTFTMEDLVELQKIEKQVSNLSLSLRLTPDGGYYMNIPLLTEFLKAEGDVTVKDGEDLWLKLMDLNMDEMMSSMQTGSLSGIFFASLQASTDMMGSMGATVPNFYRYEMLKQSADMMKLMMGDQTFQQNGDSYTWTLGLPAILEAMDVTQEEMAEIKQIMPECQFSMTMDLSGKYSITGSFKLSAEDLGTFAMNLDSKGDSTQDKTTFKLSSDKYFNFQLDANTTITEAKTLPDMNLPAGAQVFDVMKELMMVP